MDPVLKLSPLYHKYWPLPYRYIPYIISTSPVSQVLDYVLPVHPPYQKNWTMSYRNIPSSKELGSALQVHPLNHKYWTLSDGYLPYIASTNLYPTGTSPISQVLVLQIPPLYHKYGSLSYRKCHYIPKTVPLPSCASPNSQKRTGHCPTGISPISQVPVLQTIPCPTVTFPYHKHWILSYCYGPNITITGPCTTGTSPISQVLDHVLQLPLLYHKYCVQLSDVTTFITKTAR